MIKIYSNKKKWKLLHIIYNLKLITKKRFDLCNETFFLQSACLNLNNGNKFLPHMHIWKKPRYQKTIAQESWLVLRGKVLFYAYDIDGSLIKKVLLNKWSVTFTFEGGHTYEALTKNTKVLEYKTGPYEGIKRDKVYI